MDHKDETQNVRHVDNPDVGHERRDINVRIVVGFGAALLVAAIVIHLFVWLLFDLFGHLETPGYTREFPMVQPSEIRLPPSPRLQDKPRQDLKALRKQEDQLLNSYTWIDQPTGAVRVPIWQAMNQVMQQGFPVEQTPATEPARPSTPSSGRAPDPSSTR